MSLENGDGILDYDDLRMALDEYKKDDKIFEKALMLLTLYLNKSSWPHSVKNFEDECEEILKGNPYWIARMGCQLKNYFENEKNAEISEMFKRDLYFFASKAYNIMDKAYYSRINPIKLNTISSTKDNDGTIFIKFSRTDDTSLDLSMSQYDIIKMIDYLENLIGEK